METTKYATLGELLPPEGVKAVAAILRGSRDNLHNKLVKALAPYQKELEEQGVLHTGLAYAIETEVAK